MDRHGFLSGSAALAASLLVEGPALAASPQQSTAELVTFLKNQCSIHKVPSASFAVLDGGRIYAGCTGMRSIEHVSPATTTTVYEACSNSKMIAAVVGVILAQKGKVDLDGDLTSTLRALNIPAVRGAKPVTLRRLLGMSAGANVYGFGGYPENAALPNLTAILHGTRPASNVPIKIIRPPGTKEAYSGGGYELARAVMERATATPLDQLASQYILKPLGMTRSSYIYPLATGSGADNAFAYNAKEKPYPSGYRRYPELAAAGFWTTPTDFAMFGRALSDSYNGRSGALLSQHFAKQIFTNVDGFSYGIGATVRNRNGIPAYCKSGVNAGFQCYFMLFPAQGQAASIMTNSDNGSLVWAPFYQKVIADFGWPYFPNMAD